jgi:hypothetical protein
MEGDGYAERLMSTDGNVDGRAFAAVTRNC